MFETDRCTEISAWALQYECVNPGAARQIEGIERAIVDERCTNQSQQIVAATEVYGADDFRPIRQNQLIIAVTCVDADSCGYNATKDSRCRYETVIDYDIVAGPGANSYRAQRRSTSTSTLGSYRYLGASFVNYRVVAVTRLDANGFGKATGGR